MSRATTPVDFPAVVICDTREQLPYSFAGLVADKKQGGGPLLVTVEREKLDAGDYSLLGFNDLVAVERKSAVDLFGTLGRGRERFERELERLAAMTIAAIVVEATWPEVLRSPPPRCRLPPKTVFRSVMAWQHRHPNIHWWFVGERRLGEITTIRFLESFLRKVKGSTDGSSTATDNTAAADRDDDGTDECGPTADGVL